MAHIHVDYDGLSQQASTLGALVTEYEGLNARLKTLSSNISDSWKGQSAQAYTEMMNKYSQQAQKITSVLQEFLKYAKNANTDFQTVDQECAGIVRNAF